MDRFKPRTSGSVPLLASAAYRRLAACGLAAAVALSGCGAGQVSQMATQEPAVNGTSATLGTDFAAQHPPARRADRPTTCSPAATSSCCSSP